MRIHLRSLSSHRPSKHNGNSSQSLRPPRCPRSPCGKRDTLLSPSSRPPILNTFNVNTKPKVKPKVEPKKLTPPLPKQESRPLPTLSPTDVLISIKSTGLCGSDLHYYTHFRNGDIQVHEPLTLGHESSGIITAIGSPSVSSEYGLNVGDRVALEVGQPCEACELCCPPDDTGTPGNYYSGEKGRESGGKGGESTGTTSRYNICRAMRFRSSAKGWPQFPHAQGTLQEVVAHPAKWCHKLPESVDYTLGALAEPLAVAMHAAGRAGIHFSPSVSSSRGAARVKVLVFGAGAVGLLCAAVCKSITKGDAIVVIADIQADRVKFAVEHGFADAAVVVPISDKRPETIEEKLEYAKSVAEKVKGAELVKGLGGQVGEVNVTFECTGVESCLQSSIYVSTDISNIFPTNNFICTILEWTADLMEL